MDRQQEALRRVVEALEKSKDTHGDFEIAMRMLQRHSFAEAAKIAKDYCTEALAFAKGVRGE
jgi:vacuolar-type H+-ATPase subunit H